MAPFHHFGGIVEQGLQTKIRCHPERTSSTVERRMAALQTARPDIPLTAIAVPIVCGRFFTPGIRSLWLD
jgi:hypothetical protein